MESYTQLPWYTPVTGYHGEEFLQGSGVMDRAWEANDPDTYTQPSSQPEMDFPLDCGPPVAQVPFADISNQRSDSAIQHPGEG
jgi:hypothetical protein